MGGFLTTLKSALAAYNIVKWIVRFFEKENWKKEGRLEGEREQLKDMHSEVDKALDAESNVDLSIDGLRNDPNNRDRDEDSQNTAV